MSPLFKAIREAAPTLSVGMPTADLLNLGAELAEYVSAGAVFEGKAPAENARAILASVAAARPGSA